MTGVVGRGLARGKKSRGDRVGGGRGLGGRTGV